MANAKTHAVNATAVISRTRKTLKSAAAGLAAKAPATSGTAQDLTPTQLQVLALVESKPRLSIPEYATLMAGQHCTDAEYHAAYQNVRNALYKTPRGQALMAKGYLAIIEGPGRRPKWFRDLTPAQQAKITVRKASDQQKQINNSRTVTTAISSKLAGNGESAEAAASSIVAVRKNNHKLVGLGRKWLSQRNLNGVRKSDDLLADTVKAAGNILISEAEATAALDRLVARIKAA